MANTANKPAAAKPAAKAGKPAFVPVADRLASALSGIAYPAPDNYAAWLNLLASVPAVADAVAAARAGKYNEGKGLVPPAARMATLTAYGATLAETGTKKNGKPNVQAATCRAVALASAATGGGPVCAAAVVFFMVTNASVLALLHTSKACAETEGKGALKKYIGRDTVPSPRWCADYLTGNVSQKMAQWVS